MAQWPARFEAALGARGAARIRCTDTAPSGEQAHDWALAGLGLVRRSVWDAWPKLADGRLVEVLSDWTSDTAPIQVVFPSRRFLPARTGLFIDLLVERFAAASQALAR